MLSPLFYIFTVISAVLPFVGSYVLTARFSPSAQQYQLITSFSLLVLGMFLASLATLNFSLAFLVGLLATPLSFVQPFNNRIIKYGYSTLLALLNPCVVVSAASIISSVGVDTVLEEAAFGWDVWGMYTPLVIWCVWWPAWVVGSIVVLGQIGSGSKVKTA